MSRTRDKIPLSANADRRLVEGRARPDRKESAMTFSFARSYALKKLLFGAASLPRDRRQPRQVSLALLVLAPTAYSEIVADGGGGDVPGAAHYFFPPFLYPFLLSHFCICLICESEKKFALPIFSGSICKSSLSWLTRAGVTPSVTPASSVVYLSGIVAPSSAVLLQPLVRAIGEGDVQINGRGCGLEFDGGVHRLTRRPELLPDNIHHIVVIEQMVCRTISASVTSVFDCNHRLSPFKFLIAEVRELSHRDNLMSITFFAVSKFIFPSPFQQFPHNLHPPLDDSLLGLRVWSRFRGGRDNRLQSDMLKERRGVLRPAAQEAGEDVAMRPLGT